MSTLPSEIQGRVTLAHHAMATRFELRIAHPDVAYARQAAADCFQELDRLDALLNRHDEASEISAINRLRPGQKLRLCLDTFTCLSLAFEYHALTDGAFDPTLGPALDALRAGKLDSSQRTEPPELSLDTPSLEISVTSGTPGLDLGGIGKGFALDILAEKLREWDITNALLVAGGSSILALGEAACGTPWMISLGEGEARCEIPLRDEALGASGITVQGEHILNPRTWTPHRSAFRAWAFARTAAAADAFSTAWLLLPSSRIEQICLTQPGLGAVLQARSVPSEGLSWFGSAPPPFRKQVSPQSS